MNCRHFYWPESTRRSRWRTSNPSFLMLVAFAFASSIGCLESNAQSSGIPKVSQTDENQELSLDEKLDQYRISIDVESISLGELLDEVKSQLPGSINVIIRKGARDVIVPSMTLDDVSLNAFFNAIQIATESAIHFETGDYEEIAFLGIDPDYEVKSSVTVVNVSQILARENQDSLLSAIEIGLQMMGSSRSNVELKLHEETKLLFVKGSYADTEVIMQVASELGGHVNRGGLGGSLGGGGGAGPGGGGAGLGGGGGSMGGQTKGRSNRTGGGGVF